MIKRDELIEFIHYNAIGSDLMAEAQKLDKNANGVQIHGMQNVSKVAVGVSMNMDFLQEAVGSEAQFCITHHGLSLTEKYIYNSRFDPAMQSKLKLIFENDLSIAGYHYTLDNHPKIGNNAKIIEGIGAKITKENYFDTWGWVGEFDKPVGVAEIAQRCSDLFEHDVFAIYGGKQKVKRVGVVSGGGKPSGSWLFEIFEKDIDLHITGEIAEGGPSLAKDGGFNYFACGHYATEVFGVQALGKKIKDQFKDKIEVEFIDISNPI